MPVCGTCGTKLSSYGPEGLCPHCLLHDGLALGQVGAAAAPAVGSPSASGQPPSDLNGPSLQAPRRFGDYELLEEIASGGMGVVYKARQMGLNRVVALKMMLAGPWASADFVRRFHAEAEAAASLQHPNIVAIHEVGEHDGQPYFSMDYVEGRDLARVIAESGARMADWRQCAQWVKTVAEAVHYAHQHGILHRDLKPSNILIDQTGQPRITDFGLAKRLASQSAIRNPQSAIELTLSGQILGSPNYLPPEQAEGRHREVGPASDVYSLGAVLYHLLAGRPPFHAATITGVLQAVSQTEPVALRLLSPSVPRDLETICLKCLEKDVARRYPTAQALADELGRFLCDEPIQSCPVSRAERIWRWCKRRPMRAALIAALVVVTLVGAGGVIWQWGRAENALRHARESLWQANFERAHAWRTSGQMGQRVQALAALSNAAALRLAAELRTEAIAALALPDLEDVGEWHPLPSNIAGDVHVDARLICFAVGTAEGRFEARRFADGALVAALTNRVTGPYGHLSRNGSRLAVYGDERSFVWDIASGRILFEVPRQCCLELSPDGRQLLCALPSAGVVVTNLESREETARLDQAIRPTYASFSPRGDRVVLVNRGTIEVWNLATRHKDGERRLPNDVHGLAWKPDGTALALGCADRLIYVWNWADDHVQQLQGHLREGVKVCYNPGGDLLASGAFDGQLRLWNTDSGLPPLIAQGLTPLGFSADGQWLAVIGPKGLGRLRVHCPAECRLLLLGPGPAQQVLALNFSPDGRWLAGMRPSRFFIWSVAEGRLVHRQSAPQMGDLAFLDAQTLMTASVAGLQMWTNTANDEKWTPSAPFTVIPPAGRMRSLALSRDRSQLAVGQADGSISIFDLALPSDSAVAPSAKSPASIDLPPPLSRTEARLRLRGQSLLGDVVFHPDGQWLAAGSWNSGGDFGPGLGLWSVANGQSARNIPLGNCVPHFSPNGRWFLAAGSYEYQLYAVEGPPDRWREVCREPRPVWSGVPGSAHFAAHRDWIALLADERIVRLLEVESRRELARLTPLAPRIEDLVWSADGRWLAGGSDLGTHLWDLHLLRARLRDLGLDWE